MGKLYNYCIDYCRIGNRSVHIADILPPPAIKVVPESQSTDRCIPGVFSQTENGNDTKQPPGESKTKNQTDRAPSREFQTERLRTETQMRRVPPETHSEKPPTGNQEERRPTATIQSTLSTRVLISYLLCSFFVFSIRQGYFA